MIARGTKIKSQNSINQPSEDGVEDMYLVILICRDYLGVIFRMDVEVTDPTLVSSMNKLNNTPNTLQYLL